VENIFRILGDGGGHRVGRHGGAAMGREMGPGLGQQIQEHGGGFFAGFHSRLVVGIDVDQAGVKGNRAFEGGERFDVAPSR
jgi:hypothetical protein